MMLSAINSGTRHIPLRSFSKELAIELIRYMVCCIADACSICILQPPSHEKLDVYENVYGVV